MRFVVPAGVIAIVVACIVVLTRPTPARSVPMPVPESAAVPVPVPAPAPAVPAAPATPPRSDAEHAVADQLALIDAGNLSALRDTFTPDVRARVTADAFAACRVRIHQVPVRPDWEMAEDGTDDHGRPVRRVSMFGKSMTGFHEQPDGRWLADAVWCLPVGLP